MTILALTVGILLLGIWCPRDDKSLLEPFESKLNDDKIDGR